VRRRDLPSADLVVARGRAVSDVPLTVLEAAVALGEGGSRLLDRAASDAERKMIVLLRDAGLTGWRMHYPLDGYELDFAFPEQQVDGWAWHHDAEAFRRDRQRQNALVLVGWTILRFTWHDLTSGQATSSPRSGPACMIANRG
jgi:very-short-patch-repair endonuclease